MPKRTKLLFSIFLFKIRRFLKLFNIDYDIMKALNNYYKEDFNNIQKDKAVILPHCLISQKCPARFSKTDGILCVSCNLCNCGKIRELAQKKGYTFYISPSVGFTKRLTQRKNIKAVIGVACDYEISRGLKREKIINKGVKIQNIKVIPQGIRLKKYDCINNEVDWKKVEEFL